LVRLGPADAKGRGGGHQVDREPPHADSPSKIFRTFLVS
jgi:hypothetical protein